MKHKNRIGIRNACEGGPTIYNRFLMRIANAKTSPDSVLLHYFSNTLNAP